MIIACPSCTLTQEVIEPAHGEKAVCCRCGRKLAGAGDSNREVVRALALAGLIFYFPANLFPILKMYYYGAYTESTIWDGCVRMYQAGYWGIATIVFAASILVPLLKLIILFLLVSFRGSQEWIKERARLLRFLELIGPWAMLDIFLVTVLVALVRLEQMGSVLPGPGLVAFAGVVVCTMVATAAFNPAQTWKSWKTVSG